jgi:general stress protein CsbA
MPPYWLGLLCGGLLPAALLTVIFFHPIQGNVFYVSIILFVSVLGASIAAALYSQNWLNIPLALLVSLPSHLSVIAYQQSNSRF